MKRKYEIKPFIKVSDEAVENMGAVFAYELREQGIEELYTKKQMLEFAEDKCQELVNWYVESTGDVNHAAEMGIWLDDEFPHD